MDFVGNLFNIVEAALGLGFVIFIHELGHFLLAKWNDVKVEKFSIGFGPALWGFERGETKYVLAVVPLGGYVKMLGEEPEDESGSSADPRAFNNKSVGARMAIITAGVVMNVILGFGCFTWAFARGVTEIPAKIGVVKAGSPAYEAGLRPGDEIVEVDGRKSNVSYDYLSLKTKLTSAGQKLHLVVRRAGVSDDMHVRVEAKREDDMPFPSIGILPAKGLILAQPPFVGLPGTIGSSKEAEGQLKPGDTIVAVGLPGQEPTPVADSFELNNILARERSQPLVIVVERPAPDRPSSPTRLSVTVPPAKFVSLGIRAEIEPISSLQSGSIAEKAGFRLGDRVVKVNGSAEFDPMSLPDLCFDQAGKPVTFEVERPGASGTATAVTLTATPDATPPWIPDLVVSLRGPLGVPGLGLAYHVRPRIAAIADGSPAAKAGLKVGDTIDTLTIQPPKEAKKSEEPAVLDFKEKKADWWVGVLLMQDPTRGPVEMTVNGSKSVIKLEPEADANRFSPDRGLKIGTLSRDLPPMAAPQALEAGFQDTGDKILQLYAMLRSLFSGRVSHKMLGGPVLIARAAYSSADMGFTPFLQFLGMLSINLAVLNFLPIPPLDGGQMVFLVGEKVYGRPVPERLRAGLFYAGLAAVICLMVFVLCQDVIREWTGKPF